MASEGGPELWPKAAAGLAELAATPDEKVSAPALAYANRLSDFLFVAARRANNNGANDVLWVPGANR